MLRGGRAGGQGYRAGGHHRERAAATPRRAAHVAALAAPPHRPRTGQRHLAPETRASARLGATALDSMDLLDDRCVVSVVGGKLGSHLLEYTILVIV